MQDHQSPADSGPKAADIIRQQLDLSLVQRGRVVIIGLGGIGIPLTRTVARFLSGVCRSDLDECIELVLCDGDAFNHDNLYRMDVPDFGNKAEVLGVALLDAIDCPDPVGQAPASAALAYRRAAAQLPLRSRPGQYNPKPLRHIGQRSFVLILLCLTGYSMSVWSR